MFKLRSGSQGGSGPTQTPSIESIRRQARQRLIGASVLVLVGIIGLPWLFDTQPRPVPVDIVVDIPAKDAVAPLSVQEHVPPAPALAPAAAAVTPPQQAPGPAVDVAATADAASDTAVATPATPTPAPAAPATPAAATKVPAAPPAVAAAAGAARPAAPAVVPAAPKQTNAEARAQAILEGRSDEATVTRVVVQVGAFAEHARAQEVRMRLERAGLKTYTHVAQTAQGPRIRVRLGPFSSRAQAEQAAEKVRQLNLPATILTL